MVLKRRLGDIYCCVSLFFFSTSWQTFRVCHHCFHSQMLANNWSAFHSHFHCSHTVTLWAFFFSSNPTECLINSELFLNLRSGATFVLIMLFVAGNKDTCSHCKKKKKSIRGIQRRLGYILLMANVWTITRVVTSHLFVSQHALWWCSLTGSPCENLVHVGLCYWCKEPCKKKTAPRMIKWKIFHCSTLIMVFWSRKDPSRMRTWIYLFYMFVVRVTRERVGLSEILHMGCLFLQWH